MGGMIAQTMAIAQPERVRSLTSIMSTTGKRTVGWQHPSLLPVLLAPRGRAARRTSRQLARFGQLIGSPAYPEPRERDPRPRADETFDRGVQRQRRDAPDAGGADPAQPRPPAARRCGCPTLVVHGLADKMVHVSGGRATAAAIPGAELLLIDGMGHDLPPELFETFIDAIRRTADRA